MRREFRDLAMDPFPDSSHTADYTLSHIQCLASLPQFQTVATAKAPDNFVVTGAHGLLRGFLFQRHINDCLFELYAWGSMEDVSGQQKNGILWELFECVLSVTGRVVFWSCLSNFAFKETTGTEY